MLMIVKLVTCDVLPGNRDRFAQGQCAWATLSGVAGFCGQVGGWSKEEPGRAVIVGFWRDQGSYDGFMRDVHDSIFDANGQRGSYTSGSVTLWEELCEMPGARETLTESLQAASLIRTIRCCVRQDRVEHFQRIQRDVCRSNMRRSEGMLGGIFARGCHAPNRFLVCTFWRTEELYDRYRTEILPGLRAQAQPDGDCESMLGLTVRLESSWTVQPELGDSGIAPSV